MKKMIPLSFKTMFSRIMLFNLILVILATMISSGVFLNYFKNVYDDEIVKYNMQTVKQTQYYVDEQIIEKVINIPNQYFTEIDGNSELVYPLYNDIRNELSRINDISTRLASIKSTMDFIDTINVYYVKSDLLFTNAGVQFLDNSASMRVVDIGWLDALRNTDTNVLWLTRNVSVGDKVDSADVYVRSIPYFSSRDNRQAVIAITINKGAIYKRIANISSDAAEKFILISGEGNIILDNTGEAQTAFKNDESIVKRILTLGDSGKFETEINGKLCVLSFVKSQYNSWKYVSVVSIDDFYKKSNQLIKFLVLVGILLLFINIVFSILFTKTAYKPIASIIKMVSGLYGAFSGNETDNSNSEYKLLSNTVKNITYKIDDLTSKLDINKPIIRHDAILKLLKGRMDGKNGIKENEELFDISFGYERIFSFILKIHFDKNLSFENEMLVYYNIIELLENESKKYEIKAVIDENNVIAGIVNFNQEEDIENIIAAIREKINSLINVSYVICIGNIYHLEEEQIAKSYSEAVECFKYTYTNPAQILHFKDLNIDGLKKTGSSLKLMRKVEDHIRAGNEEELKFIIEAIIHSVIEGGYTVEYCKNTLMDLVSTIRTTLINLGYDENELFGYDIREYYKTIISINEFKDWIHTVIDDVLVKINENRQETGADLEPKIHEYIRKNIFKNLSQEQVAEGMGLSPYLLNKVVKASTGKNFIDYIVGIKFDFAASLLEEEKFSVKDIASKLGYGSPQYFIRVFKEKYGYTPKEYQKKMSQNK